MKKIFLSIVLFVTFYLPATAQVNPNIINNSLGKFEGIWMWISGTDTVKLFLKKEKVLTDSYNNFISDAIVGFHLYQKGTIVIETCWDDKNITPSEGYRSILVSNNSGDNVLEGSLNDRTKHKLLSLKLTLNANHTQLTWLSSPRPGISVNQQLGQTLPRNMILIKQ